MHAGLGAEKDLSPRWLFIVLDQSSDNSEVDLSSSYCALSTSLGSVSYPN